jgi:hypothetical protein
VLRVDVHRIGLAGHLIGQLPDVLDGEEVAHCGQSFRTAS